MKQKHPFSLIEVILALGVCVIGLCSVMVLFPIGANANRDASMETYAAQAAEQILNYIKFDLQSASGKWNDFKTAMASLDEFSDLNSDDDPTAVADKNTWKTLPNTDLGTLIFRHKDHDDGGLYQVVSCPKDACDVDDDDIDSRMILRVIATDITMRQANTTTDITISRDYGMRLLVEASWPAEQPYASRQKSVYSLDVFKNN